MTGFPFGTVAQRVERASDPIRSVRAQSTSGVTIPKRGAAGQGLGAEGESEVTYRSLLIVTIIVVTCGVAAFGGDWFTGSWSAEIGLSPLQTMPFSAFESTLDAGLHIGFMEISSISDFLFEGWIWQEFDATADVGFLVFDGQILFEPQSGSYVYAQGVVSLQFPGFCFSVYGAMVGPTQSESMNYGFVVDLYGEIFGGNLTFESATFLGADLSGITFVATSSSSSSSLLSKTFLTDPTIDTPPICFSGQEFTITGLALGCIGLTSVTTFDIAGFESEEVELSFIGLFGTPLTLTLDYVFTTQSSSHVFRPTLETSFGCFTVYSEILGSGGYIDGIAIYGIAFEFSIGGATLSSISNLDTTQYVITTPAFGRIVESLVEATEEGHLYHPQEYWEIVTLTVDVPPAGCGFIFSVDTFFSASTGLLFDWAQSTMTLELALGTSVSTATSITVDTSGFSYWGISFEIFW